MYNMVRFFDRPCFGSIGPMLVTIALVLGHRAWIAIFAKGGAVGSGGSGSYTCNLGFISHCADYIQHLTGCRK